MGRGFAASCGVLLVGAGGLDHLVDGAVAPVGEAEGEVVDYLGFLVGKKVLVVSAGKEKAVWGV
ncbi:MAG: hypothetical protein EOP06_28405 [Proteobacteria bacterium]|nr:MAG: hypothetical protein EOP06_28405 [Pseudomonadota bacterium]